MDWAVSEAPKFDTSAEDLEKMLYRGSPQGLLDAMRLEVVQALNRDAKDEAESMMGLIGSASSWKKPVFPVSGKDLLSTGEEPGLAMGEKLKKLEEQWIESGFKLDREELLKS